MVVVIRNFVWIGVIGVVVFIIIILFWGIVVTVRCTGDINVCFFKVVVIYGAVRGVCFVGFIVVIVFIIIRVGVVG